MNSIDVMASEMRCQLEDLPKIQPRLAFDEGVFVGSGDSYVASLATRYFGPSSCVYPTDLLANPDLASNKTAFFVSISGNTQANISAAEAVRKKGRRTIAITANPSSRLAKVCDQVVQLNYTKLGKTAGTIGFTSSLLACIMLATKGKTGCPANLQDIYSKASEMADGIGNDVSRPVVLLGDTFLLPAAMYFALKLNEVFGTKAFAYPLEEFCHSPLFGLKDKDVVMVFGIQEMGRRLSARLEQNGVCARFFDCSSPASIESLLYAIFLVQHMVLKTARKQGLEDCYFLSNKRLLEISSDFIYG